MRLVCYFIAIATLTKVLPCLAVPPSQVQLLPQLRANNISLGQFFRDMSVVAMHRHTKALLHSTEFSSVMLDLSLNVAFGSMLQTLENDDRMIYRLDVLHRGMEAGSISEQEVAILLGSDLVAVKKLRLLSTFRDEASAFLSGKHDKHEWLENYESLFPDLAASVREVSTLKAEGVWRAWHKELARFSLSIWPGYQLVNVPQSVFAFTSTLLEQVEDRIAVEEEKLHTDIGNAKEFLAAVNLIRQRVESEDIPTNDEVQQATAIGGDDTELNRLIGNMAFHAKLMRIEPVIYNVLDEKLLGNYRQLIASNTAIFSAEELNEIQQALDFYRKIRDKRGR